MTTEIYDTIFDLLQNRARVAPFDTAILNEEGATVNYGEMFKISMLLAGDIATILGELATRPRIGICMPNGIYISVALLAATIAGEATPFNPSLKASELERYFAITSIDALLVIDRDRDCDASAVAIAMGLPVLELSTDYRIIRARSSHNYTVKLPTPSDISIILMTSGSTGVPKVVPLSHENVCVSASDVSRSLNLTSDDKCLVMWQQFHIGGLVDLLLAPLSVGSSIILTSGFNEASFFKLNDHFQPTWFQAVPTTLAALAQYAELNGLVAPKVSLRLVRCVGAALPSELQLRFAKLFRVPIVRTLGMTEASPLITSTRLPPAPDKIGSVGLPCGPEVRVFCPKMISLSPNNIGQVGIRGRNVFRGYENNPDANASSFRDGWFLTGDLGYFDPDGDLFLTGRAKEQINRGGYKIMPAEVEEALYLCADVHEAAVFGVTHPTLGEDIAAAVSLKSDALVDASGLRAHLSGLLAANKVPSRITIMPELPRNAVGKVDRLALAELSAAEDHEDPALVAPRNKIERFVACLWAHELSVPAVGIYQDFMSVGGDSLSSLRIIVAMETAFGRKIPDDLLSNCTTVAETAETLINAQYRLSYEDALDVEGAAGRILGRVDIGTEANSTSESFLAALSDASSESMLDAAFEQLFVYSSPSVIKTTLEFIDLDLIGMVGGEFDRNQLLHHVQSVSAEILNEIDEAGSMALRWRREDLSESAFHFSDPLCLGSNKTLIVGFTGKFMRLMLPTYRFLMALDATRFDLLLLRDSKHKLFADGLAGFGTDLFEVAENIDNFSKSKGYVECIAFGVSGGGLAAIHTGILNRWGRAVASSPPSPNIVPKLANAFQTLSEQKGDLTTKVIIAHSNHARDADCARQINDLLPSVCIDYYQDFYSHNLISEAHRAGNLHAMFKRWFC